MEIFLPFLWIINSNDYHHHCVQEMSLLTADGEKQHIMHPRGGEEQGLIHLVSHLSSQEKKEKINLLIFTCCKKKKKEKVDKEEESLGV